MRAFVLGDRQNIFPISAYYCQNQKLSPFCKTAVQIRACPTLSQAAAFSKIRRYKIKASFMIFPACEISRKLKKTCRLKDIIVYPLSAACFLFLLLLGSAYRTNGSTSSALQTSIRIDYICRITLRDAAYGTFRSASSAADACITDFICHSKTPP